MRDKTTHARIEAGEDFGHNQEVSENSINDPENLNEWSIASCGLTFALAEVIPENSASALSPQKSCLTWFWYMSLEIVFICYA